MMDNFLLLHQIRQNESTITISIKEYIDSLYVLDKSFQVISLI